MGAQIGPREPDLFDLGRPDLLLEVSGLKAEAEGRHVLLDAAGFRSLQRLALAEVGGGLVVGFWPAELKPQAQYVYSNARGEALVEAARAGGWNVRPNPHMGFFNSMARLRLYLDAGLDPGQYVRRWEGPDADQMRAYSPPEVRLSLWPWLKDRGYATDDDDKVLEDFLRILGRRKAHLRPGLHLDRRWSRDEVRGRSRQELAAEIRDAVNRVLRSLEEPPLPVR